MTPKSTTPRPPHWSTLPENFDRAARWRENMARAQRARADATVHWTQTPAGRRKMAEIAKVANKTKARKRKQAALGMIPPATAALLRRKPRATRMPPAPQLFSQATPALPLQQESNGNGPLAHHVYAQESVVPDDIFAYALGRTEQWIETYAQSAGISPGLLAAKLGSVLCRKSGR